MCINNVNNLLRKDPNFRYVPYTLVGIMDSDGTYTNRITEKQDNKVGFSLACSFCQATRNADVLTPIQAAFDGNLRTIVDKEGHSKNVLDVFDSTPGGIKLFKVLDNHKPFVPGKRKDFLISKKVLEFATTGTMPGLDIIAANNNSSDASKIGSIASIRLIYHQSHQTSDASDASKKKKSESDWHNYLKPSFTELKLGLELADSILAEIELEVAELVSYLNSSACKLPSDYIAGHYIGDGSFMVWMNIPDPYYNLSIEPAFTIVEDSSARDVLEGMRTTFGKGNITSNNASNTAYRFKITGWEATNEFVITLFRKYESILPDYRLKQFKQFEEIVAMGLKREHLTRNGYIKMINLIYELNPYTSRKPRTLARMLEIGTIYFDHRERKP